MTPGPAAPATYWAAGLDPATERDRLRLLERRSDPHSARRLAALGVGPGWSCLEVGAGAGSIARWLAGRVAPGGRVVAVDRDPRFLADLDRVDVRRLDLTSGAMDGLAGRFDLVHARALLAHLPDPRAALVWMAATLRPGGWLVAEEADYVSLAAADPDHPAAGAWDRLVACAFTGVPGRGAPFDAHLGRRLPGLLAGIGLERPGHEAVTAVATGAGPSAAFLRASLLAARAAVLGDLADPADREVCERALGDPTFRFLDVTSVAAWGCAPQPH